MSVFDIFTVLSNGGSSNNANVTANIYWLDFLEQEFH